MKIGICTGGGDCPGLNAAISAAVNYGVRSYGMEIIGIQNSFNGLMERPPQAKSLVVADVANITYMGGTILGTASSNNPFSTRRLSPHVVATNVGLVVESYGNLGLDGLIVIGGDGTQTIAAQMMDAGLKIIGIPKTIDNDLPETDYTLGFDTAVATAVFAVENLQTTAQSHSRTMILEVMGRHAGHIALHAGLAGNADVILIPEIPYRIPAILAKIRERAQMGYRHNIVVVAEGAMADGGNGHIMKSVTGKAVLGGVSEELARVLNDVPGLETRTMVLGHLQRGGRTSHFDRIMAVRFATKAVDMAHGGQWGNVVVSKNGQLASAPYRKVAGKSKPLSLGDELLASARKMGICLGQ